MRPAAEMEPKSSQPTDMLLRRYLGYGLKRAYVALEAEANALLAAYGLRATPFAAFGVIVENPGLTQTALASALQMERSSVVVIIDLLEEAELISRNRVDGDRRTYALVATRHGQKTFARICAEIAAIEDAFQAQLTEEQRRQLLRWLHSIENRGKPHDGAL